MEELEAEVVELIDAGGSILAPFEDLIINDNKTLPTCIWID